MKVSLAYAERQLRHWTKKVEELRLMSNAFDASNTERNEEGKEKFPPDPLIEKGQEEKKAGGSIARAKKPFVKPTIEEVAAYCKERGFDIDPEQFWHYYESKDWVVGKVKMSKWHSAVATWVRMRKNGEIITHKPISASPRVSGMVDRVKHADNYLPPSESLLKRLKGLSKAEG